MARRQERHVLTLWSVVAFCCGIVLGAAIMAYTTADLRLPEIVIQQPPVIESPEAPPIEQPAVAVVIPVNDSVTSSKTTTSTQPAAANEEPAPETDTANDDSIHVTVIDVDEAEMRCGVQVGSEFKWIAKGDLEMVGGVYIYVSDVVAVHSAGKDVDACELVIGGYGKATATQR